MEEQNLQTNSLRFYKKLLNMKLLCILSGILALLLALFLIFYIFFVKPPADFPLGGYYSVEKGATLNNIANDLEASHFIRSAFWFKAYYKTFHNELEIKTGDYVFNSRENTWTIANRLASADYKISKLKFTIPEGYSTKQIGEFLEHKFFKIKNEDFLLWSKRYEGYLFPDTYFWPMNISSSEAVTAMKMNFEKVTNDLKNKTEAASKSWSDIIKMASIIELEANTDIDRHIVSDILWRRIKIGMPLQTNSTLKYVGIKNTFVLNDIDKSFVSPYNTYLNKGLTPTPICNPGIEAIEASLNPQKTPYLYFLTGHDGKMYYAKTYEEHLKNKELHLN